MKIKILMDSTSDLSEELIRKYDMDVVPLVITQGESTFPDYSVSSREFFRGLRKSGDTPKTSQPNPAAFLEKYRLYCEDYDHILVITVSSGISGTYNSASIAKRQYDEERRGGASVHVFDSGVISLGMVLMGVRALEMAANALRIEDIIAALQNMKNRIAVLYTGDTLDYLRRGGRVSNLTAAIGSVLNIKPIISIVKGRGVSYARTRGIFEALKYLADRFAQRSRDVEKVYIVHADAHERVEQLKLLLQKKCGNIRFIVAEMRCALGSHCGPGVVGVCFEQAVEHTL